MREREFIRQNKQKWEDFEKLMEQPDKNPEQLSQLFIQLTDDLSYARTYYGARAVRLYLNQASQRIYARIFKSKKNFRFNLKKFWFSDLPIVFWEARKSMIFSLIAFLISFLIGVISTEMDIGFAAQIMGEDYIQMTLENIRKGEPMGVYQTAKEMPMFVQIAINNLMVSFLVFALGALGSVGSIGILLRNGVMVGCFQYFFHQQGLLADSALVIWLHGTIEISCIVLAGAAGIELGKGLLFPGTLSRKRAFQWSARRGSLMMLGISPFLIFAAFIEGFVTRYASMPDILKLAIILLSVLLVLVYFVWLPFLRHRQGHQYSFLERRLPAEPPLHINLQQPKSAGTLIQESLSIVVRFLGKLSPGALLPSLGVATLVYLLVDNRFLSPYTRVNLITEHLHLSVFHPNWIVRASIVVGCLYNTWKWLTLVQQELEPDKKRSLLQNLSAAVMFTSPVAFLLWNNGWCLLFILILLPLGSYLAGRILNREPADSETLLSNYLGNLGTYIGASLIIFLLLAFTNSGFVNIILEGVSLNFRTELTGYLKIRAAILSFIGTYVFQLGWQLLLTQSWLIYFSNRERTEASHLLQKITALFPERK